MHRLQGPLSQCICTNTMLMVRSYWLEQYGGTERQMSFRQVLSTTRAVKKYRLCQPCLQNVYEGLERQSIQSRAGASAVLDHAGGEMVSFLW